MSKTQKLIEEIEKYGKVLFEYSVEETNDEEDEFFSKVWAGDCVVYEYALKKYEITTWNENSINYDEGEKTLKEL